MTSSSASRKAKIQAATPKSQQRKGANPLVVATVVVVIVLAAVVGAVILGSQDKKAATTAGGSALPKGASAMGAGILVNPSAPANVPTLDLYEDFQCPICAEFEHRFGADITSLADKGQVKLVYHTLSFLDDNLRNDSSNRAANAAACAADQDKFLAVPLGELRWAAAQGGRRATPTPRSGPSRRQAGITGAALTTWDKCYSAKRAQPVRRVRADAVREGRRQRHPDRQAQRQDRRPHGAHDLRVRSTAPSRPPRSDPQPVPANIPSPTSGVWHLGPFPSGPTPCASWPASSSPSGSPGGAGRPRAARRAGARHLRLGGAVRHRRRPALPRHHHPAAVLRRGRPPARAFNIWEGGLGIWGADRARRAGRLDRLPPARGLLPRLRRRRRARASRSPRPSAGGATGSTTSSTARPPTLPWGLTSTSGTRPPAARSATRPGTPVVLGTFQPTFLYESLWCLLLALALVLADRRFALRRGSSSGSTSMGYPLGRIVFELMRSDEANHILGLRVNVWTSILVFLLGIVIVVALRHRGGHPRTPESHHTE